MTAPAADCHAHVFGNAGAYPYAPGAPYLPSAGQAGTARDFRAVLDAHGFSHALLVGPAPYGTDNRCLIDALAASQGRFKGIALVDSTVSDRDLDRLDAAGVVGIRFNLVFHGSAQLMAPGAARLFARLKEMNWFLQLYLLCDDLQHVAPMLRKAGVRLLIDHLGRPDPARGLKQPGFQALLELGRSGGAVVKLSGPFRSSRAGHPYSDMDPYAAAALEAFTPQRCIWGSDWPFVCMDERMDYGPPLACLDRWLPDPKTRRAVLWETPARLFGFK